MATASACFGHSGAGALRAVASGCARWAPQGLHLLLSALVTRGRSSACRHGCRLGHGARAGHWRDARRALHHSWGGRTLVALLASPRIANLTGSNYVIDGGFVETMW